MDDDWPPIDDVLLNIDLDALQDTGEDRKEDGSTLSSGVHEQTAMELLKALEDQRNPEEEDEDGYSSSDNIPLSIFCTEIMTLGSDSIAEFVDSQKSSEDICTSNMTLSDSCGNDPDFEPAKNDGSSDSDAGPKKKFFKKRVSKIQKKVKKRSRRSIPKVNSTCNSVTNCHPDNSDSLQMIQPEANKLESRKQKHQGVLDELLVSNGLIRLPVYPDGNCFFTAAAKYITSVRSGQELRQNLCDHMKDNSEHYKYFLQQQEQDSQYINSDVYLQEVCKLRASGYWASDLADLLPLALANWTRRSVRIFSSDPTLPVLDIDVSIGSPVHFSQPILLAHIVVPGLPEHYDACINPTMGNYQGSKKQAEPNRQISGNNQRSEEETHGGPVEPSAEISENSQGSGEKVQGGSVEPSSHSQGSEGEVHRAYVEPSSHNQKLGEKVQGRSVEPSSHSQGSGGKVQGGSVEASGKISGNSQIPEGKVQAGYVESSGQISGNSQGSGKKVQGGSVEPSSHSQESEGEVQGASVEPSSHSQRLGEKVQGESVEPTSHSQISEKEIHGGPVEASGQILGNSQIPEEKVQTGSVESNGQISGNSQSSGEKIQGGSIEPSSHSRGSEGEVQGGSVEPSSHSQGSEGKVQGASVEPSSQISGNNLGYEEEDRGTEEPKDSNGGSITTTVERSAETLLECPKEKEALYITPPKRKNTRKRMADPRSWKKNMRKQLRLKGEEHINTAGKHVSAKTMKRKDCSHCRYKCSENVSEECQEIVFDNFWKLDSYERKKDFVCGRVKEKETKTYLDTENHQAVPKRRQVSREFTFEVGDRSFRVCKGFFLATLDISNAFVDHALKHKSHGVFLSQENRGRHAPHNKTPSRKIQEVQQHIESFPVVAPHYTRRDTNRKFLGPELNITRMYHLYEEHCEQLETEPVKPAIYRKIFNEKYNYSFHVPKKDQCVLCTKYHRAKEDGLVCDELETEYQQHQERKIEARQEKENDKMLSQQCKNVHATTFDLEAVLSTPCSLVSQIYYKRKLNCYNLSVYSLGNQRATCYMWNETEAQRGSSEIGTCLYLFVKSLPMTVDHVILYSDTCTGQNRNQYIAAALMHTVKVVPHIKIIEQKFLESGHTHMECDSMHSAIEFAKKKTSIHVPHQWNTVVRMARRRDPYTVVPLKHEDFLDFKDVARLKFRNVKTTTTGSRVNWLKIKSIKLTKDEPDIIFFRYSFSEPEYQSIHVTGKSKRGRPSEEDSSGPPRKYTKRIPISGAKKADLVSLCKSGIIPEEYHQFYTNLPSSNDIKSRLPLPDAEEEDVDSE